MALPTNGPVAPEQTPSKHPFYQAEHRKFKLPERKHVFYIQTLHAQGCTRDEIARRVAERFPDLHEGRDKREDLVTDTVGMETSRWAEKIKPTTFEPELAAIELELAASDPKTPLVEPEAAMIKPKAAAVEPQPALGHNSEQHLVRKPEYRAPGRNTTGQIGPIRGFHAQRHAAEQTRNLQARPAAPIHEPAPSLAMPASQQWRQPRHGRARQQPAFVMSAGQQRILLPASLARQEPPPHTVLPTGALQLAPPPIKAHGYAAQDKHIIFIQTLHALKCAKDEIVKRAATEFPDLHEGHPKRMEMVRSTVDMHTVQWAKLLI